MRLWAYIILCAAMIGYGWYEHTRFLTVKSEYSEFKSLAVEQTLKQEKAHAKQVSDALDERDASLQRLRNSEKRSDALRVSIASESSGRICYRPNELNGAYRDLVTEIRTIAGEGQTAMINLQATLAAWPK